MSKKIIIALLAISIIATCVFVACDSSSDSGSNSAAGKTTTAKIFIKENEYPFVTDDNGEKILNDDGEFLVYSTNDNGIIAKDKYGEKIIENRAFEAYSGKGFIEEYGYRFNLPDGWKSSGVTGRFQNKETGDQFSIEVVDKSYQDFYQSNYNTYENLLDDKYKEQGISVTWEEGLDLFGDECEGVVRFTLTVKGEGKNVLYILRNKGNIYKLLFESPNIKTAVAESEKVCKGIAYKPYDYFSPVTDEQGRVVEDIFPTQPEKSE